jgi:hypothetical protein
VRGDRPCSRQSGGRGNECKVRKVPQELLSRSYERCRRDDAVFAAMRSLDSGIVQLAATPMSALR